MTEPTDRVAQAVEAVEALRELIPQAHAAVKDLQRERRAADAARARLEGVIADLTEQAIREEAKPVIERELATLSEELSAWSGGIYDRVQAQAMELVNVAVFGHPDGEHRGDSLLAAGLRQNEGETTNLLLQHARKPRKGR
jgi:hypothetical protein